MNQVARFEELMAEHWRTSSPLVSRPVSPPARPEHPWTVVIDGPGFGERQHVHAINVAAAIDLALLRMDEHIVDGAQEVTVRVMRGHV